MVNPLLFLLSDAIDVIVYYTPAPVTWAQLTDDEPRLRQLAESVTAGDYGRDERAWVQIKKALDSLVGHGARSPQFGSTAVWEIASRELRRLFELHQRGSPRR